MGRNELTEKQMAFVDNYLETFSVKEAYIRAGFSTNTKYIYKRASEVFNNKKVQAEIKRRLEELKLDKEIMLQKLIQKGIDIMDNPDSKTSDVLKSMEYLAKLYSLGGENVNVKTENELQFNISIQPATKDDREE